MPIERESQRRLLETLAARYPDRVPPAELDTDEKSLTFNLAYLGELGLVKCKFYRLGDGSLELKQDPCITARGLDFLKADGGFTAILGVVTVKLHADTIRDLLASKIQAANIAPEEKAGLLAKLASLPGTALEKLTEKLVEMGVDHAPDAFDVLQRLLILSGPA